MVGFVLSVGNTLKLQVDKLPEISTVETTIRTEPEIIVPAGILCVTDTIPQLSVAVDIAV